MHKTEKTCFFLGIALVLSMSTPSFGSPLTKQQLEQQVSESYMENVKARLEQKKPSVEGQISSWSNGEDPEFYGGNSIPGVGKAFLEDFKINLTADFLNCFDFQIIGICKKHGIPSGFRIKYHWPMQNVHTHGFFQNRYMPDIFYQAIMESGLIEAMFYPMAKTLITPLNVAYSAGAAWQKMLEHGYAVNPGGTASAADVDLKAIGARYRYATGLINGDTPQLEYTITPTAMQGLWFVVENYFPILKIIPCLPDERIAAPFSSEDPVMIHFTRNPFVYPLLYKDKDLQKDYALWMKDPSSCIKYNMNQTKGNIPYNMYDGTPKTLDALSHPQLLEPMPDGDVSKYKRLCTENWGATLPFTTTQSVNTHDVVHAGINFEKAIRLGVGIFKTFLVGTGADKYVNYYQFDKDKDKIQYTFHDGVDNKCHSAGSPAELFSGADTQRKEGMHGLYSITHWKYHECCVGFF